jgi:hypothetical protein
VNAIPIERASILIKTNCSVEQSAIGFSLLEVPADAVASFVFDFHGSRQRFMTTLPLDDSGRTNIVSSNIHAA